MYEFNFHSFIDEPEHPVRDEETIHQLKKQKRISAYDDPLVRKTVAEIYKGDDLVTSGITVQRPNEQDIKAVGQKYAVEAALDNSDLSKEERRQVWNDFFNYSKKTQKLLQ